MSLALPGSDLSLAPTLRPVIAQSGQSARQAMADLAEDGFHAVQLDATLAGLRPRDLDQRARRDLVATAARAGLQVAGLDLFIPRNHFLQSEHVDRAMTAVTAAIELAADLGRVPVSVSLPVKGEVDSLVRPLAECADSRSVRLAVHAEDQVDALLELLGRIDTPALGAAIDPAAALAYGQDPSGLVHRLAKRLAVARLCDLTGSRSDGDAGNPTAAGLRCDVGDGDLDVIPYRIALSLTTGLVSPVVLDLRGTENARTAGAKAARRWAAAGPT